MINKVKSLPDYFSVNPKVLLLIDGTGALLTAFFLAVILARFQKAFGMPIDTLYFLSAIACGYSFYSFFCSYFLTGNKQNQIRIIAFANIAYCCITIGFVLYFRERLTVLGWSYFLLEFIIISCLASIELTAVKKSVGVRPLLRTE